MMETNAREVEAKLDELISPLKELDSRLDENVESPLMRPEIVENPVRKWMGSNSVAKTMFSMVVIKEFL